MTKKNIFYSILIIFLFVLSNIFSFITIKLLLINIFILMIILNLKKDLENQDQNQLTHILFLDME